LVFNKRIQIVDAHELFDPLPDHHALIDPQYDEEHDIGYEPFVANINSGGILKLWKNCAEVYHLKTWAGGSATDKPKKSKKRV
jgi:hypothetical protein